MKTKQRTPCLKIMATIGWGLVGHLKFARLVYIFFQNTIVQRFDLVCSKDYLPRLSQTLFFTGTLVGALICGQLSDKFGRKTLFLLGHNLTSLFAIAGIISPNGYVWMVMSFFKGMSVISSNLAMAVYQTEIIGGRWRSIVACYLIAIPAQLSHTFMGFYVYLVPNIIIFEIVLASFGVICLPLWKFMPESPRWLLMGGKKKEAIIILEKVTKSNGNPEEMEKLEEAEAFLTKGANELASKQGSVMDFFRYPGIRRNFLILCYVWFCLSICYYGLVYNTPTYGWNIYLVFVFPTFFTAPAFLISPYLENHLGRKFMLTVPLLLSGIATLCTQLIPKDKFAYNWPVIFLCTAGVVLCFLSLSVGYTFTKELFPTMLRATGLSITSVWARLGAMLFPLIAELDRINEILPLLLYGFFSFTGALLSVLVWPETSKTKLPDTLEECEARAQSKNKWLTWVPNLSRKCFDKKDSTVI